MYKKLLIVFVLLLIVSFSTTTFASLTFTTDAITGTTASSLDLGAGNALSIQTTGNGAINLGAGLLTSGGGATFTGTVTGSNIYESANSSLGVGNYALNRTNVTYNSVAVGQNSLRNMTGEADSNVAIGVSALDATTSGSYNTGVGEEAMYTNTTGSSNTALGFMALYLNSTASNNVAIGHQTLRWATAASNTTAIGHKALAHNTTGTNNVAIGYQAGETGTSANNNLTGSNNTWVGYNSGPNTATQLSNASAFGNGAMNSVSNQVVLGNASVTEVQAGMGGVAKTTTTGLQLKTGTKPTCDVTVRGLIWYVAGGAGVADTGEMCRKDGADAYAWVAIY